MKNKMKTAVLAGMAALLLAGCGNTTDTAADTETTETTETPTPEATEEATEEPTEEATETPTPEVISPDETEDTIPDGYCVSYLTGEYVPESQGRRRPVAIMLNNIKGGCPQSGIANAGVVYEAPVEGGITRLMGIFEDYDNLDKIGSVRSCRDYYIFYASGFDAIYCHYGQAAYALPYLELDEVNNLSGLAGYGDQVYYRTTDRSSPHNVYTSFEGIQKGIEINGYSQEYDEDFTPGYAFCDVNEDVDLGTGIEAYTIKPGYFSNEPWFEYNPEDGLYYRYQYGEAQIDELTGEQIAYKNVIFQYSTWRKYDENGYLNIDVDAGNTGLYFVNGQAMKITWDKKEPWGATYYYDASNGVQITMDTGKTWVCIIQDSYEERVEVLDANGQPSAY